MDAGSQEVRSPNFRSTEKKQKIAKDFINFRPTVTILPNGDNPVKGSSQIN